MDADHIGLKSVGRFLQPCDFFTLDVADFIGKSASPEDIDAFVMRWKNHAGRIKIAGIERPLEITEPVMRGAAEAGGSGLRVAKEIYREALSHYDEPAAPYRTAIDITPARLPSLEILEGGSSGQFTSALRHDPCNALYNPDFRQFLHVLFKIAAKMGPIHTDALAEHASVIARNVTTNLLERHLRPIFAGAN